VKHTLAIVAFLFVLTGIAHGDAYFDGQPLSALQIILADPTEGTAEVSAAGAGTATVRIGDTLGQSKATIITIGKAFVVVQTHREKTKLPVVQRAVTDGNRIIFQ
jgi:hypothetical protein